MVGLNPSGADQEDGLGADGHWLTLLQEPDIGLNTGLLIVWVFVNGNTNVLNRRHDVGWSRNSRAVGLERKLQVKYKNKIQSFAG